MVVIPAARRVALQLFEHQPAGADGRAQPDDLLNTVTLVKSGDEIAGTLRIGVIPTVSPYYIPEVRPALRRAFPRLRVLCIEEKTPTLVAKLDAGEIVKPVAHSAIDLKTRRPPRLDDVAERSERLGGQRLDDEVAREVHRPASMPRPASRGWRFTSL